MRAPLETRFREVHVTYNLQRAGELVLALMQLGLHEGSRTWKSYDWVVLDDLFERGLITDPKSKAKSVVLTDEGMALSRAMAAKYLAVSNRDDG